MGEQIETLADLLPSCPRAICVGINPAPRSVAAGHYYQGQQGHRFFGRLRHAGVLGPAINAFDDDAAVSVGIGFTDVVKRPTARASQLKITELRVGAQLLRARLVAARPPVLIFPFKAAAVALVGRFEGNGWLYQRLENARLFVMPGPYENAVTASATISSLASRLD